MAPTSADRTGTARRPRPGSTASRAPTTSAGDMPARAAQSPTVDGFETSFAARPVRHHAVTADGDEAPRATSPSANASSTAQSACTPMSSSNWRIVPIGNRGDNATATSTVVTAPTAATIVVGSTMPRTSIDRLAPIARHVGASAAPAVTARTSACPTSTPPPMSAASANRRRPLRSTSAMFSHLAEPEQVRAPLDVHGVAHDLLHLVLELHEMPFAPAQRDEHVDRPDDPIGVLAVEAGRDRRRLVGRR